MLFSLKIDDPSSLKICGQRRQAFLLGVCLCLCLPSWSASVSAWDASDEEALRLLIQQRVQANSASSGLFELQARVLSDYYQRHQYGSIWYSEGGREKAGSLLTALEHLDREGLNPRDYRWLGLRKECLESLDPDRASCELKLSGTLLTYGREVGYGRFSRAELDPAWHIDGDALNSGELLENMALAAAAGGVLQSLPPPQAAYRKLRTALVDYSWLAQLGGWTALPEGALLRPGMRDERLPLLRARLAMTDGAAVSSSQPDFYDRQLQHVVEHFQERHGLNVDGIVGEKTLAALNVPVEERIAQIRSNLERWRWMPRRLPERYVAVNLPAFELSLIDRGAAVLEMRAIAGRADRPSPAFRSRIYSVVFNPEWTVPQTIVFNDILPRLRWDKGYLEKKQIKVLRHNGEGLVEVNPEEVDWRRYDQAHFPFLLRQDAGPNNSLGRLKFEMSNPYEIFLHDTPNPALFNKNVRTLSSGCIRLEDPVGLASRLLDFDEPDAAATYVNFRIASGETRDNIVNPEVTVFLLYFTVWADDDGSVHFRDDVYSRNTELKKLLSF